MEVSCGSEEVTLHGYRQEPRRISIFSESLLISIDHGLSGLLRLNVVYVCLCSVLHGLCGLQTL